MRKVILSIGIISIIIVTVLNFYKDEVINFLDNIFWNKEYVIASKYTDKKVVFKHKKLIEKEQEEHEEIKEKRGY